ncbi:MAG: YtxH domain-containing protein [Nitrospira sp.]|nr:YtxH domain-containing protein [Nitrospira sp.]
MTEPVDRQTDQKMSGCDGVGVFMVGALTFATGVLVGLAAGIVAAPHSGAYTRRQLQNLAEDAKERASGLAADAKAAIDDVVQQGKRIVS